MNQLSENVSSRIGALELSNIVISDADGALEAAALMASGPTDGGCRPFTAVASGCTTKGFCR